MGDDTTTARHRNGEHASRIRSDDMPAEGAWTFENRQVADGFDAHVREQLPWYEMATGVVAHVARHYIPSNGRVYDIGASTGNIGNAIRPCLENRDARFTAIEPSSEMCDLYRGPDELVQVDAMDYEFENFDCAILFLVLMFMPPGRRKEWLQNLLTKVKPGGCVILFDKVMGASSRPYVGTILRRLTLAGKVSTGTPSDEIINKELSLSGVQRPIDEHAVQGMSLNPHPIFRFGEFAGWVFERPE